MIKVLVVDDSAFMRKLFKNTINKDDQLKVIDTARNGKKGLEKIKELKPDVITLDIEMPVKDGIETLKEIVQTDNPVPVIMISALDNRDTVMNALDLGAFDFIPKPSGSISLNIDVITDSLLEKIKAAAKCKKKVFSKSSKKKTEKITSISHTINKKKKNKFPVIAIGCSSGGPKALKEFITTFPKDFPAGIVIVQHMPPGFTNSLAQRLDQQSHITVKEAEENDQIKSGHALIAPGGKHLEIDGRGRTKLNKKPTKWGVRPCADYMMESAAKIYREDTIGVILTGMGHDGAQGMKAIKDNNGYGIVEDKSTALVYGMPSATIEKNAYDEILPLTDIPSKIIKLIERRY